MATKVIMPQLGESVVEGTISKWIKKVGDKVAKYETICEVETDKVNAEVPSTIEGVLTEIVADEGSTVSVGELICYIVEEGQKEDARGDSPSKDEKVFNDNVSLETIEGETIKKRFSPVVLRLAEENNIDLNRLSGTGLNGRITRKDVLKEIENIQVTSSIQESMANNVPIIGNSQRNYEEQRSITTKQDEKQIMGTQSEGVPISAGDQVIEASSIRKTIAKRMVQSKHEAPHAWMTVEADVTKLVQYRNKMKEEFKEKEGFSITFLPFFIKAVVEALKKYPIINSVWDNDRIILKKQINISIAVATEDVLYVPVIHDAEEKSIYGLAKTIHQLAEKARAGKLTLAETQGGTFTVNNTGSFGSVMSAPIINYPQAAIITMESIIKKPVIIDEMIAVRDMVNLCISLDHRILDGLIVGRFAQEVKDNLEKMSIMNTKLY